MFICKSNRLAAQKCTYSRTPIHLQQTPSQLVPRGRCIALPQLRLSRCAVGEPSETTDAETGSEEQEFSGILVEDFEGLLPEEDEQVPGNYADAMNGNTKLGKAIRAACEELHTLNTMELEMLQQAESLLKKLGVKTPIVEAQAAEAAVEEEQEEEAAAAASNP